MACTPSQLESSRRWRQRHPDKVRAANKRGAQARRERWRRLYGNAVRFHMVRGAKSRASAKGLPFNLRWMDITIPACCPVLGIPLKSNAGGNGPTDNSPSIDRIIPDRGYVRGNVIVVSKRANVIKNNATVEEIQRVADFYKELIDGIKGHQNRV